MFAVAPDYNPKSNNGGRSNNQCHAHLRSFKLNLDDMVTGSALLSGLLHHYHTPQEMSYYRTLAVLYQVPPIPLLSITSCHGLCRIYLRR